MLATHSVEDHIGWIRLNRPDKLNALNPAVYRDIGAAVDALEIDDAARVVAVTGDARAFAAGADIDHMADGDVKAACELTDGGMRVQERLADLPKPTIAAISGYCLGGGLELALCCDFRIASDTAVLGLPEIGLGIIPGGGGTQRLPRLIGIGPAMRMILTGEPVDAAEALRVGLVDQVVGADELEKAVTAFSRKLAKRPAMALRAAKSAVRKGMNMALGDGLFVEKDLFCMLFGTADQKEGMRAFLEKRKPTFTGK